MLASYVNILNTVQSVAGEGRDVTIGVISKELGMTRYKTQKAVKDLCEFGMLFEHLKPHRPDVIKRCYDVSIVGSSWVHLMNLNRMRNF